MNQGQCRKGQHSAPLIPAAPAAAGAPNDQPPIPAQGIPVPPAVGGATAQPPLPAPEFLALAAVGGANAGGPVLDLDGGGGAANVEHPVLTAAGDGERITSGTYEAAVEHIDILAMGRDKSPGVHQHRPSTLANYAGNMKRQGTIIGRKD